MPGFYFDDVLRTTNGHLDKDHWAPPPKWVDYRLSASCKARENFSIAHQHIWNTDWPTDKKTNEKFEEKTTKSSTDFSWSHSGYKYGLNLVSDALKGSIAGKATDGEWKSDFKVNGEWKYGKSEWKGKCLLNACSPVMMEKMKLWCNAELEHNHKGEWNTVFKTNINYDQWHAGFAAENKAGDWSKQFVHAIMNDKSRQYFVRADLKSSVYGVGCSLDKDDFSHSYELEVDMDEGKEDGIQGTPAKLIAGGEYELNDKCNVGYTLTFGKHVSYNQSIEHQVDNNLKLVFNQAYEGENLEKKGVEPAYKFGVEFAYKM